MKNTFYLIILSSFLFSCGVEESTSTKKEVVTISQNITGKLVSELEWLNQPETIKVVDNALVVSVEKGTDFFNNPEDNSVVGSAPLLYRTVGGDLIAKALVQPDFSSQWNAVALMVHIDSLNWIKFAFENSDATGSSIVTVVTKETSDDANGVILNEQAQVWLAIAKKDNIYSMHWSKDGKDYKMARLTKMPETAEVKIGVEFQSPVGDEAKHTLHFFEVEEKTIENLRELK